ncbi:MAG: hypothetical protein DMG77_17685 [Acidobacteria bacterium]|nr:MAG: hypothetical protein DMG77_17685 [Acidobacteriota bacterium]
MAVLLLSFLSGCGGKKPSGPPALPVRITLSPAPSSSVQVGTAFTFTASAQNASNQNVSAVFTFQSSDTSVLNLAPNGVACAGSWNATFTICTPQGTGVVQVTASAFGVTSASTLVFVHPPIDNIQISEVPPVGSPPPACPGQQIIPAACNVSFTPVAGCLSTNQVVTLQAKAFSKGTDITSLVGPFTWTEGNANAIKVTPVTSSSDHTPTNQATVAPNTPGFTSVYATASGVSSHPYYAETCPVQCIAVELGTSGSQTGSQTSFATTKGTTESLAATAVDVQGCIAPKPSLTWSSSEPAAVSAPSSCSSGTTCSVTTPIPGAGSVTASCTPPSCNIGFPQSVVGLNQPGQPPLVQPLPVYPVTPISGLVSGTASATSVVATSVDCQTTPLCAVDLYIPSTTSTTGGNPLQLPTPPNSLLFDAAGAKIYVGSNYGAQLITVGSIGGSTNPFTTLGTVTGKVLAVSPNGNTAIFSDTFHTPNQVFVVTSSTSTPLNITGATTAGFSPDGMKAFILGCGAGAGQCPNGGDTLHIYSSLQALKTISLPSASANAVAFSSNGAFAFVSGGSSNALSAYRVCDNAPALTLPLPVTPSFLKVMPDGVHLIGLDNTGFDHIATAVTKPVFPALCPQSISATSQHISLGQGTFTPINFFVSPDGTFVYVVASDRSSVLVYNFNTSSVTGIPLANSATGQPVTPVAAAMTVDGTLIYVAGSDGTLHQLSTVAATDLLQLPFPATDNPFCPKNSTQPCTLNVVAIRP